MQTTGYPRYLYEDDSSNFKYGGQLHQRFVDLGDRIWAFVSVRSRGEGLYWYAQIYEIHQLGRAVCVRYFPIGDYFEYEKESGVPTSLKRSVGSWLKEQSGSQSWEQRQKLYIALQELYAELDKSGGSQGFS